MCLELPFAQVPSSVEQNVHTNCPFQILFQNPENYSVRDVQRLCYHSWFDSTVIFDQISNSNNVYLSSSRFWTATSLVFFYQVPSFSKSRIPPKINWTVQSLFPITLFNQYYCFCRWQTDFEQYFMVTFLLISTIYDWFTAKDKQTKLDMWSEVGW